MKREKRVVVICVLTVIGAAVTFLAWILELVRGGVDVLVACGGAAAFVSLAASAGLMLSRRRELSVMEGARKKNEEEIRRSRETARQELEQFHSTLAHSLRMPISIIQGYADLLANGMVDDPDIQKEYLRKISERTQYMSDVIHRQRMSREGIRRDKLILEPVDMLALVGQVVRDMQTAADEAQLRLQVLSSADELVITADAFLLNRVFYNLLENSMKYMGRPGVVTIRITRQTEMVVVQVQDDGVGMDSKEVEHIFEKNYQGSNRANGQGYGLFLVKESVEAHGGSISARSAPGQGMGITFTLPCEGQKTA